MSTDAWVRIPHYKFDGYSDQGQYTWRETLGNVWVQVTSDGDQVFHIVRNVLNEIAESDYGTARMPEGFTGRLVRAMFQDGWNSVLVCLEQPEEGEDYSYTVDFQTQSVTVHSAINHRYSFAQVRRGVRVP